METNTDEMVFDDEVIDVPEPGGQFETIPAGVYNARLVGFKRDKKPDWKLKGDESEEDKYQYKWTLEVIDGDYEGTRIVDWTNITWHEKATTHKYAAALLGVPTLPVGVGMSTRQLAGRTCQMWVVEVESKNKKGELRNYVDKLLPTPAPRQRPQRPQAASTATQKPAVGRVSVPGLGDDMLEPEDIEF